MNGGILKSGKNYGYLIVDKQYRETQKKTIRLTPMIRQIDEHTDRQKNNRQNDRNSSRHTNKPHTDQLITTDNETTNRRTD